MENIGAAKTMTNICGLKLLKRAKPGSQKAIDVCLECRRKVCLEDGEAVRNATKGQYGSEKQHLASADNAGSDRELSDVRAQNATF